MPKASTQAVFLPSMRDLSRPGEAESSFRSLLEQSPGGVSLLLFWNLEEPEGRGLPPPPGLEFLPSPPLEAGDEARPLLLRLARAAHEAGVPLSLSARLHPAPPPSFVPGPPHYLRMTRRFLALARGAETLGAGFLILGPAWGAPTPDWDPAQIRAILGALRSSYRGKIFWGLNPEAAPEPLPKLGADGLALSGPFFFPEAGSPLRSARRRARAWESRFPRNRLPFFLAEAGFPTCRGGLSRPLAAPEGPQDLEGPVQALSALREAFAGRPGFAGLSLLLWTSEDPVAADTTLRLQGKDILSRLQNARPHKTSR